MKNSKDTLSRPVGFPDSLSTPVATPLSPSVVFASRTPDELDAQYEGREHGFTYAREGHPNAAVLAARLDALEGASGGIVTSSGMAAVFAAIMGLLSHGDHIIGGDQLYGRSLRLMHEDLPRFGIETSVADPTDIEAFEVAVRPNTKAVLVEVVSNPTLRVADMEAIVHLCHERGLILMVDNTFTTPRSYAPLAAGADVVIQSVTKLLAGHSDATLGYVAARTAAMNKRIYDFAVTTGMTASPFDCWLAERGLATFDLRFERAEANAAALADHLTTLPGVAKVLYPGRSDHPDHARAQRLLGGHGCNMVSFIIAGGRAQTNALARAAEGIAFAPTLGDVGTTLSHPASSSHRALTQADRDALGMPEGFFRVSVGLEGSTALNDVFTRAVQAASEV
ncbi:MAG: aminotransferase class I/II-fold pyridoxal phosphate-dependent enzyme [Pseudomonadota bacterium]